MTGKKDKEVRIKKSPVKYDKMFFDQTPCQMGIVSSGSWRTPELDEKTKKRNSKKFYL